MPSWTRPYLAALRAMVVLTVVLGVAYPLLVTGIAQAVISGRANGSLVHVDGRVVGSALLGQSFADAQGNPLRQWFQPRPGGLDASASGASNLGPDSADLVKLINKRRSDVAAFDSVNGHPVASAEVPPDAVTASASGLDPDISVAYAREQAYRVAAARGLDVERVLHLVDVHTSGPVVGVFGTERVNVLELNRAISRL